MLCFYDFQAAAEGPSGVVCRVQGSPSAGAQGCDSGPDNAGLQSSGSFYERYYGSDQRAVAAGGEVQGQFLFFLSLAGQKFHFVVLLLA